MACDSLSECLPDRRPMVAYMQGIKWSEVKHMEHTVKKGLIYSEKGVPCGQRWFADNRLAVQFDETGVTRVEYRNPEQKMGNPIVFLKGLHDGLRYYLEHDGITYGAEYINNTVWPFGMDSEWDFQSAVFKHSIYTINDSILFKLVTPGETPAGMSFKLEFNEPFAFIPADQSNFLLCGMGARRKWEKWEFVRKDNLFTGRYMEKPEDTAHGDEADIRSSGVEMTGGVTVAALDVFIGADFPLKYVKRSSKHVLQSGELKSNKEYHFLVTFSRGSKDSPDRHALTQYRNELEHIKQNTGKQFERYRKVMASSPELLSPYLQLNEFMSLAPLYHEALKVTEHPGAVRAKTSNYWVWGWDGITANSASLYWGDAEFIREMLRFYEKTSHPQRGIAHAYRHDMSVASISDLPAQGMYIALLHHYYSATKDLKEVKERYEFAKKVYQRIAASEVAGTGFCEGTSLFPDFPVHMKETGHDISAFNNTVFYCASRSMEYLASLVGDEEMCRESESIFRKMEDNFVRLFYDEDRQFIVNSIDAGTLEKRECYSSDAIKWENEYCSDLFEAISAQCMEFFAANFVCKAGIRPMPVWDSAFDADANQLHSWWPVMGEYYMKLVNENNRLDLIDQWIGWVSYWTGKLTIPEGIPCYMDTAEPELDRWDTLCGTWQAYSIRGWYQAAIHGIVGVGVDAGGLVFFPYEGEEMILKGFHYLDKALDIEMRGSGRYIGSIEIGGQVIKGTNKLPSDLLKGNNVKIRVTRVRENPCEVYIKQASGVEFTEYDYTRGKITAKLKGAGTSRIKLAASRAPQVKLDGGKAEVHYGSGLNLATIEVKMHAGEVKKLEVT